MSSRFKATLYTFAATGAATFRPISGDAYQFDLQVSEEINLNKYNVVEVDYPGAHMAWDGEGLEVFRPDYTILSGCQQGAQNAVDMIFNTPGSFAFVAYSLGSVVAALVYAELQPGGKLEHRAGDFVGAVTFGSSVRQQGHTIPGGIDPGGMGCFGPQYCMTDTPNTWWDFVNVNPIDPYSSQDPGTTAGQQFITVADAVLTTGSFNAFDNVTAILQGILPNLSTQIPAIWQNLTELVFPFLSPNENTNGHAAYAQPFQGLPSNTNNLSAVQLAINYLNGLVTLPVPDSALSAIAAALQDAKPRIATIRAQHLAWKNAKPVLTFYKCQPEGVAGLLYCGRINIRDLQPGWTFPTRYNVSSQGSFTVRASHYIAKWIASVPNDPNSQKNIVVRFDMYGGKSRWTGVGHHWTAETKDGSDLLTYYINDDMQFPQFLLAPPNPMTPIPVIQWPRVWAEFGPGEWTIQLLFLLNLIRVQVDETITRALTLPPDPLDLLTWGEGVIDSLLPSQWQAHIQLTSNFVNDSSLWNILASRMNTMDSVIADALEDGQLCLSYRRYFTDEGEPHPTNLLAPTVANGALVFTLSDKSGFTLPGGTFFNGNAVSGAVRSVLTWGDGFIEDFLTPIVDKESLYPDEYWQSDFLGTFAGAPSLCIRDSHWNDLQSKVSYSEATAVTVVVGGDNPAADAIAKLLIESIGNLLGYFLLAGFDTAGDIAADVIMPFIVGTIAAWDAWTNSSRLNDLGWVHLWEVFQQGAENNAWSISALATERGGFDATRPETSHTMSVDSRAWPIPGLHASIGDRVMSTSGCLQRMGIDLLFIDQLYEMTPVGGEDGSFTFQLKIGQNRADLTPGERSARMLKKALDTISNIGVHLIS